ncbi:MULTISPECIES: efflux RND transporter permease subunit [unclassified Bacteroides]|jgi:HAE1 family hydrophobic/amphiphilic exporter-1|uniref:efflux RND transporter permease subunit n=1 Tax=unclassified Bacteroides TaxID=2646097 RepID=UPI000E84E176|nr:MULTISPECIES: efflux RND transporter permease subunit [unclassified Bacteroides]RGN45735.1 hydrophobe/amphiphile efflux-1 family RND transporter [Bacteroides sp. OM05-12]RHR73937.1 hydrophobe/amphiphile efflux-1 family RND transporter [Bacteroides sp. AF16-49]
MKLDKFINRPVLSTVISIVIVILGILGLLSLPISQYPDIAPPTVRVSTTYQGANAQTVLNSVIAPLEEQINGVENMMYMTSTATNTGEADIQVYFKQGTDPDMAAVNVQNRVAKAQGFLPAEVTKVGVITSKRQTSMLLVFSLYSSDDKYDNEFLENYAKINVIPEVQRVPGVGDAMVLGADYSMRIWLKPDVMAQYKLMPTDITNALSEQNIEAAPGSFGESGNQTFQYTLRYKGRLQTQEEFENIVIRATEDGQVLRLKDVAGVELGRLTYGFTNLVNGHPGVTCIVFQTAGSNATQIINDIEDLLKRTENTLPPGVKVNISQNANDFLFASIHEVIKTLLEAFLLVFIVVYIFLQDFRSTLIPAIAIPVALVGTFFILYLIGFSINLLTLCAMVLAIAIVVDDAIVVVEGVHAKLDQGYKSARLASIDAMSELGGAIVSITLVMMSVFIPVSFMSGTSGTFYRQFGLTMAIAIGLSAINALTLTPALCAILLKPHKEDEKKKSTFISRFHIAFNVYYDNLLKKYKKGTLRFIHKPWLTIGFVVVGIAALLFFMKITPTGLVPNEDTGTIMAVVDMPPGSSKEFTEATMMKVDSLIAADPAVESRTMIVGYSFLSGQGPSYGSFICKLKNWEERDIKQRSDFVSGMLYLSAMKVIKDARVLFFAPPMIPGYSVSNGFELNLQDKTGGSLDKFYEVAQEFIHKLQERPEIQSAQTSFNPNFPQYMIDIDAAACKKAGISPSTILTTLQGYYGGLYTSNFNRFGKLYRVMIQADPSARTNLESLKSIMIRNGNEMAPISQFMSMKRVYGPDNIKRFNMFTAMTINGSPADGYSSGQAIQAMEEVAKEVLPTGYGYEFSGMTREEQSSSGSTTAMIFILCFVFVYLLLSAQYESYILPLAVLLSIPFGLAGSFILAHLMGLVNNIIPILGAATNNIYMQIALIMLIGLLAKNAILIVEFALDRRKMGMSITWAAVLGAAARLRPILMTSLAMVVGLLPMMFAFGVGANGNRALGTAAVGGMLIGMICQIFVVPALFVIFQYLQEKIKPLEWEDMDNSDVKTEIEQYSKNKE